MARARSLSAHSREIGRASEVCTPRRTAVRERPHSHRSRTEQDPQRHRGQVAHDARLRLAVCPGLGLSWPPDRARGAQAARIEAQPDVRRRLSARVPRLCREVRRPPTRRLHPPRHPRRLVSSVLDDVLRIRSDHRPGPGTIHGNRHGLQRPQADLLVLVRPDRARRSGSGIRRGHLTVDLRALPPNGRFRQEPRPSGREAALRDRLDDDAVDAAGEPGDRGEARLRVFDRRARWNELHHRQRSCERGHAEVRVERLPRRESFQRLGVRIP